MPSLFGGGSSNVPAPTVNTNPGVNNAQFYQPQNQVGADTSYTALLNSLLGPYNAGQTTPQQLSGTSLFNANNAFGITYPGGPYDTLEQQIAANPYYGQAQGAANTGAGIFSDQQQMLANDLNAAITGGFAGQLGAANFASGLPGQAVANSQFQANLAPTLESLGYSTGGLGPILAALEAQIAPGIGATQGLAGQAAGQIPGINQAAGQLSGLSSGLMGTGSPLAAAIARLAARPEGISALQGGAQNVLDQSRALYNAPAGAGQLMAGGRGILGLTNALTAPGYGAGKLMTAGQGILDQGAALAAAPAGAGQLMRGSTNLLNAGYDPRSELRTQLTQQTTDESNALNAMSGLASSPYGTGLTRDALTNFNIDWQNQQLAREQAALQGATSGFEGASALRQGKQNLLTNAGQAAAGLFGEAAGLRQAKEGIAATGLGAAGQAFGEAGSLRAGREGLLTSGLGAASGAFGEAGSLLANKAGMFGEALSGTEGLYQGAGGLTTQAANALAQGAGVAGTAGGLYGQAAGIGGQAGALTSGIGNLNDQELRALLGSSSVMGQATGGLQAGGGLAGTAAGIYGGLPGTANAATAGVGALASGAAGAGALPGQAFMGQQDATTRALNSYMNAINSAQQAGAGSTNINLAGNALPEAVLSALGNYLKLGQNASLGGGALGQIAAQNQGQPLEALGALGVNPAGLAFGSQGLSGALGLGNSGLLGSFGTAGTDFSSAVGEVGTASSGGSGVLGFLQSLFGPAEEVA